MISTLDISSLLLQISSNELSTDKRREPVERTDPAVVVAVAGSLVGEVLVGERQRGHVACGHELDRHQGLPLRRAAPGPGENQLAVCHHFAKLATDLVLLAAREAQHHAITCQGSMTSARANSLARKKNATTAANNGCSMPG